MILKATFTFLHHQFIFFFLIIISLPHCKLLTTVTGQPHTLNDNELSFFNFCPKRHQQFGSKFGPLTQVFSGERSGESLQQSEGPSHHYIYIQHTYQHTNISIKKCSKDENHSSSDSHNPISGVSYSIKFIFYPGNLFS